MPPIPSDIMKVQMTFDLGPGVDVSVMGWNLHRTHFGGNDTPWQSDCDNIAQQTRDSWIASMEKGPFGPGTKARDVAVYHLDTTGHALDKGQSIFEGDNTWQGTASNSQPWETSLVVSLLAYEHGTFVAHAARKRGRFYLPPLGVNASAGNSGAVASSLVTTLAANLADFLSDVKRMELPDPTIPGQNDYMTLGILSKTAGEFYPILEAYFDNRFDVQRRRQNKQDPARTFIEGLGA